MSKHQEYFSETDPRGVKVICHNSTWNNHIVPKHRIMRGNEEAVKEAIKDPDYIYVSTEEAREVYFKTSESATYSSELFTKVVTHKLDETQSKVISAWPQKGVKGNIDELKYKK